MKQILLLAGSAALAAALLCSCATLQIASKVLDGSGQAVEQELEDMASSIQAAQEVQASDLARRTYTTSQNITKVEIQEVDANLSIKTGNTDEIRVTYIEPKAQSLYTFEVEGNTLKIRKLGRMENLNSTPATVIVLPARAYEDIEVEADNASLTLKDLDTRRLNVEADNISLDITGGNADQLSLKADSAAVELSKITAQKVEIEADNGAVHFDQTQADAYRCDLHNGAIEGVLMGRNDEYNINVSARDEHTNLKSNGNTSAKKSIDFTVNNGGIRVRLLG